MGHPATGGHKYEDLVLQVGGWPQSLTTLVGKKIIAAKSKVQTGWYLLRLWLKRGCLAAAAADDDDDAAAELQIKIYRMILRRRALIKQAKTYR
jgi:hypothetical protein